MPPPEVWGPATWTLLHVLAENVNEFVYPRIVGQMFDIIKRICSALPCPECAQDATIFLSKVRLHELRTKNDFKNMIYMFHNYVNSKKRKPLFNYANLEIYKRYNIVSVFNRFISVYHTKGNMKLLAESFQRQLIVKTVREWFSRNICFFIPTQQAPSGIQEPLVSEEVIGVTAPIEELVSEATVEEEPISNCCGYIKETVISEAIEPEVAPVEEVAPEPEVIAPEPEVVAPEPEVIAPEPEVIAPEEVIAPVEEVASEPEVFAPEPEVIAPEPEVIAPEPEVIAPVEEVAPEPEVITPEEVAPVEVQEVAPVEVQEEVVQEEEVKSEEETVPEEVVSEPAVTEEPVKAKRGRKKKTV